jgi:uncharacterized protein (TIGR04255 family)
MTKRRHYSHAPITEAIIDLQITAEPGLSINDLQKAQRDAYTKIEPLKSFQGRMQLAPTFEASGMSEDVGFILRTADGKQIQQVRMNGFTLSRLEPYSDWETFSTEARRCWEVYRSIAKPVKIERAAVRYVNRLDLPMPVRDFGDYLRTAPVVSPDLPQGLSGYFMQLHIPLETIKGMAIINQTLIDPVKPNTIAVVLDIDVFSSQNLPQSEGELWSFVDQLRDMKNFLFEGCITDPARELFK